MGDVIEMDKSKVLEAAIRLGTKNLDELFELRMEVQRALRFIERSQINEATKILREAIK